MPSRRCGRMEQTIILLCLRESVLMGRRQRNENLLVSVMIVSPRSGGAEPVQALRRIAAQPSINAATDKTVALKPIRLGIVSSSGLRP